MYKVMLADDDYPVIEFLNQELPWDELNLKLIGYAEDGLSALAKAQQDMPDILITDIGMPGMDGIELAQHLKQLHPGMRTVILSCHDEFHYTRQAVQLQVQDYVLKESMEIEEIVQILKKLVVQLDEERIEAKKNQGFMQSVKQNQDVLKEKLISKLLHAPIFNEEEWYDKFEKFGVSFSGKPYLPVNCYINQYDKQMKRFQSEEVLAYAVSNVVEEILDQSCEAVYFRLDTKELLLLFAGPGIKRNSAAEFDMQPLREIQSAIHKYVRINVSYVIGEHYSSSIKSLKKEINTLLELSDQRFYLPDGVITRVNQVSVPFAQEHIFQYYAEVSDALGKLLMDETTEQIDETISGWFRFFVERRFHPEELKSFILRLVMDQYVKFRSSAQYFEYTLSQERLHQAILSVESVFELEVWLNQFWKSLIESISMMSKRSRRMEIIKAQKYVLTHLDQKITLEDVSDKLHLNPAYFSRLYKKETQESFIGYVTRMKVEKAKEWLETTNKTVEEIAYHLGYDNKSYFNKCFKSIYNMSPSQLQKHFGSKSFL
ncbi:AraC family transcriptional regulator [Paenibacillus filicis]|uniref:AraC family transcriptional regulator n=1 Tax=Paenibacillus gyeongsangnamensis TaxID=3388067 RepID=A0ABT4QFK0_9BACL|nr:AraC family transcriptional regulator [Paenibacillus filicis]MCZ8515470.1 AraC family transcriptional regulator [Paenibacillus filicis]